MSSKISAKFFEIFRNLKSDAVPRPPRQEGHSSDTNFGPEARNENVDYSNQEEEIRIDTEGIKKSKKPKLKKSSSVPNKESSDPTEEPSSPSSSNVNTQATGNVINIVNSNNVRWGNEFVYYMGPVHGQHDHTKSTTAADGEVDEEVEKTDLIQLILESNKKADREYLDYISKHLGRNWHRFFRKLGYKQGEIETMEIDMAKHGVVEARYKLLLDWIRNDDYGTVGRLSTVLWECGERQIVKELAAIHSRN